MKKGDLVNYYDVVGLIISHDRIFDIFTIVVLKKTDIYTIGDKIKNIKRKNLSRYKGKILLEN